VLLRLVNQAAGGAAVWDFFDEPARIHRRTRMKYVLTALMAVVALVFLTAPARADWAPNDPVNPTNHKMHWPQLPDLQTGLDVRATLPTPHPEPGVPFGKVLADDFKCTQTGQITDIHIWGSWLNDWFPYHSVPGGTFQDPGWVRFRLSLHANLPDPDGPTGPDFSKPGEELWSGWFDPGMFEWQRWAKDLDEGFMDPNIPPTQQQIIGRDTQVFQYNFYPDPLDPRLKQEEGRIYWLDVTAIPLGLPDGPGSEALFGWKSTHPRYHYEDDAVYGHMIVDAAGNLGPVGDWLPLKYPFPGPYEGQTMDLAFVITPEPGTVAMLVGAGLVGLVAYARRRRKG
jgi:hypothetical protein